MLATGRLRSVSFGWLAWIALVGLNGCAKQQTANQALDTALQQSGISKSTVYPLEGTVQIDGHAPETGRRGSLLVMLWDPAKLNEEARKVPRAQCDDDGHFAFTSYVPNDGVKPGTYVLTFVQLTESKHDGFVGPDKLNNRYNDPEKNAKIAQFKIEHNAPGKTDHSFDLKVEGEEPVRPAATAVTSIKP